MRARRLPLGLVIATLLAFAGCGGDSGAAPDSSNPASVTPQSAAVYGEVLVRPSGDVAEDVRTAIQRVALIDDPGAELAKLLEDDDDPDVSFARDIEPWLGDRVAVFILMPSDPAGDPDVGILVGVRDRAKLDAYLEKEREPGDREGTYRGVEYAEDEDAAAAGVVGDFLVVGTTQRAFRESVDAWKASSLADEDRYASAVEALADDRLAFAYLDTGRVLEAVGDRAPVPDADRERLLKSHREAEPVTLALTAQADEIALELAGDVGGTPLADLEAGGVSVGELPGDAWLAAATPALGPLVRSVLDVAGAHDVAAAQLRAATGLDLDRDVLDAVEGVAAFARGTTPLDIGGGLLLKTRDERAAATLVPPLQTIVNAATDGAVRSFGSGFEVRVPQLPQSIIVLSKGDRIAGGYGGSSIRDLLEPGTRFDESVDGKAAIATLGEGYVPSVVLVVPPVVDLLDSLDSLGVADVGEVLPYLRAYRSLAIGTKRDDDRVTVRVVAALR